jgi:exonuclease III
MHVGFLCADFHQKISAIKFMKKQSGFPAKTQEAGLIAFFNVHLSAYPYEPYDFRDGKVSTPEQAVQSAAAIRIPQINTVLKQMATMKQRGIPVFLAGDFNEASHLDWTHEAASAGKNFGHRVEWPVSVAIINSGMEDAFRSLFPDPLSHPGITWTPWKHTENEVFDRIDIIYHQPLENIKVKNARIVGKEDGDIRLPYYDSDHYALLITYQIVK